MNLIENTFYSQRSLTEKKNIKRKVKDSHIQVKSLKESFIVNDTVIDTTKDLCDFLGCEYSSSWDQGIIYDDDIYEINLFFDSLGLTKDDYYIADADDIDHGVGNPNAPIQAVYDGPYGYFTVNLLEGLTKNKKKKRKVKESNETQFRGYTIKYGNNGRCTVLDKKTDKPIKTDLTDDEAFAFINNINGRDDDDLTEDTKRSDNTNNASIDDMQKVIDEEDPTERGSKSARRRVVRRFMKDFDMTKDEAEDALIDIFCWENGLTEDTVKKSNGKWANRGDTGKEHGTFKTKKQADAQRKAMYANGYKGESLKESTDSDDPLDLALMSYETGHWFGRDDFEDEEEWLEYSDYMEYGPNGFYDEFKNDLDFSQDFIDEFGDEDDYGYDYEEDDEDDEFEESLKEDIVDTDTKELNKRIYQEGFDLLKEAYKKFVTYYKRTEDPIAVEIGRRINQIIKSTKEDLMKESLHEDYDKDSTFSPDYNWEMDTNRFDNPESPYYNGDLEDSDFDEYEDWDTRSDAYTNPESPYYVDYDIDESFDIDDSSYEIASRIAKGDFEKK